MLSFLFYLQPAGKKRKHANVFFAVSFGCGSIRKTKKIKKRERLRLAFEKKEKKCKLMY
jgi:hypothetical protein